MPVGAWTAFVSVAPEPDQSARCPELELDAIPPTRWLWHERRTSLGAMTEVRPARADELHRIRELEDLAGERYAEAGIPPDLEGLDDAVIAAAHAAGLLWVAEDDGAPIGFALCWLMPDALHLRELDVHPKWMGRGVGRRLVEYVAAQAERRGLRSVTLTTFRDVHWNAPLYRRWGFAELDNDLLPPWLAAIRHDEDQGELRRWPRVAMARPLP